MALNCIVTGATGGLGYEVAAGLARAGHRVLVTGRSAAKGDAALGRLWREVPGAAAEFALLDVASLRSVAAFADGSAEPVDILVNNAAVMGLPQRELTEDGFEKQIGTNYLGHFALTGRLLHRLNAAPRARVVSLASLAHRRGQLQLDDFVSERSYSPRGAYAQSKLAMLVFARELQRRAAEHGAKFVSIAAHPGWSATRIVLNGMGQGLRERVMQSVFSALAQPPAEGARPILFAALDNQAQPGGYYGPSRLQETRGPPSSSKVVPQAQDVNAARRLWALSEQLTGVHFNWTD